MKAAKKAKKPVRTSGKLVGFSLVLLLVNLLLLGTLLLPYWAKLSGYLGPRALAGLAYASLTFVLIIFPILMSRKFGSRFFLVNLVFQILVLVPTLIYGDLWPLLKDRGTALPLSLVQDSPLPQTAVVGVSLMSEERLDERLPRIFVCNFGLVPQGSDRVCFGTNSPHVRLATSLMVDKDRVVTRTIHWTGPGVEEMETGPQSSFILKRPEAGWKLGRYQATISVENVVMETLVFYIVAAPDPKAEELHAAIKENRQADIDRLLAESPGLAKGRGRDEGYSVQDDILERETILFEPSLNTLGMAVAMENDELCRRLLKLGASPNIPCRTYTGILPLHVAARAADVELIELLVEAGADLNPLGGLLHQTPLQMALSAGSLEAAEALLKLGASTEVVDMSGCTPLTVACLKVESEEIKTKCVKLLLKYKADPNLRSGHSGTKGSPPIFSGLNSPDVVSALLEAGADLTITNGDGESALDVARKRKYEEVEKLLVEAGAK